MNHHDLGKTDSYIVPLLVAGVIPHTLSFSEIITIFYYLMLIPPAGYQCLITFRTHLFPYFKGWFPLTDLKEHSGHKILDKLKDS